ncbi:MAG: hypothetical protein H0T43_07945 [Solirubrobacterales bacterium]|nr:hypothetical protein [Solirubrobacterales bacterium]
MTKVIRAWDEFRDLSGRTYDSGVMCWGRGVFDEDQPVREGDELRPHEAVGSVECGPEGDGLCMSIGVVSFGTVRQLLVSEGEEVWPGQPLMEFDERPPTMEEWEEESDRAFRAELREREHERILDRPGRALAASLRRFLGRS